MKFRNSICLFVLVFVACFFFPIAEAKISFGIIDAIKEHVEKIDGKIEEKRKENEYIPGENEYIPEGVSNFNISSFLEDGIVICWEDISTNESGFELERDGVLIATLPPNTTYFVDLSVTPGKEYQYRIRAYYIFDSRRTYSIYSTLEIEYSLPPSDLLLTNLMYKKVKLEWKDNSLETEFSIFRGTSTETLSLLTTLEKDCTTYIDGEILPYTTYFYRVSAYKYGELIGNSNIASIYVPPLNAPSDLSVVLDYGKVKLSWKDNSTGESGFLIQRSTDGINFSFYELVRENITNFIDENITEDEYYYYRVCAYDENGYSDSIYYYYYYLTHSLPSGWLLSTFSNISEVITLSFPTSLNARPLNSEGICLEWKDNSTKENGYVIERKREGENYATVVTLSANTTWYIDFGLTPKTTYFYRIYACNIYGNSEYSNESFATTHAKWTFMIYMDADNNLEFYAKKDLEEIAKVGSDQNINVTVLIDRRSGEYTGPILNIPDWESAKWFFVEKNQLYEIEDKGELNMGDSASLENFIVSVVEKYPADKYALILWNHGKGWKGFGFDETNNGDKLTLNELSNALFSAQYQLTTSPIFMIDLIGFDACLMADIETMYALSSYGKVLVASQELEPGVGWDYEAILNELTLNPSMDAFQLGKIIADTYEEFFMQNTEEYIKYMGWETTLSVIDLAKISDLTQEINELALWMKYYLDLYGRDVWLQLAKSRYFTPQFGGFYFTEDGYVISPGVVYGRSDLYQLADYIFKNSTYNEIYSNALDVKYKCMYSVHYSTAGVLKSNSKGISVFLPITNAYVDMSTYGSLLFSQNTAWDEFLYSYFYIQNQDQTPPIISDPSTWITWTEGGWLNYVGEINGDDIATYSIGIGLPDGTGTKLFCQFVVSTSVTSGYIVGCWDGKWYKLSNNYDTSLNYAPLFIFEKIGVMFVNYWEDGNRIYPPKKVTLLFYLPDGVGGVHPGLLICGLEGTTKSVPKKAIPIKKDSCVEPLFFRIDTNGYYRVISSGEYIYLKEINGLYLVWSEAPLGYYRLGFISDDWAGNIAQKYMDVTK